MYEYFRPVYSYAGKEYRTKGYWIPKRQLGQAQHFSDVIKATITLKEIKGDVKFKNT